MRGGVIIFNADTIRELAMEILRTKYDLKTLSEEEALNHYFEIYKKLKDANSKLPKSSGLDTFK